MKIAIVANKNIEKTKDVIEKLEAAINESDIQYDVLDIDSLQSGYDFVFVVGGDGTMLKTSRFYSEYDTPVMGINLGRLGFLSLVAPCDIDKLVDIVRHKKYEIQNRIMLKSENLTALNDFVIKGHSPNRTSKFNLYINNKLVSDYIADGLIISTPTGSTAYGLSAGGPILSPEIEAVVIVPICAHTMTARPLVVPCSEKILVETVDESLDLYCDGQESLLNVQKVEIVLSQYRAKLAFPKNDEFYSVLRNKLHWGVSPVSCES